MCKFFSIEDLLDIDYFQSCLCENCPKHDCEDIGNENCLRHKDITDIAEEFKKFNNNIKLILDRNKNI